MGIGKKGDTSITCVNHSTLKEYLKVCYNAKIPAFIWGAPGIGKSAVVDQVAKELGIGFVDIRISQFADPSDLKGLPKFEGEGNKASTKWIMPSFWPKEGKGIIFLDELNLAPQSMLAPLMQLMLDRKLGEYVLPEGWMILAAGNRSEDRAGVFNMSAPLRNRMTHIQLDIPKFEDWLQFELKKMNADGTPDALHSDIAAFLAFKNEYIHTLEKNPDSIVFATNRIWGKYADRLVKTAETFKSKIDMKILLGACVGSAIAMEFDAFRKLHKKIDMDELLKNPKSVKEINAIDMKYCVASALSGRYNNQRKDLSKIIAVCNELDPEFGALTARMLLWGNAAEFQRDYLGLVQKGDKPIKEFMDRFAKYLKNEE